MDQSISASTSPTPVSVGVRYGLLFGLSWILVDFLIRLAEFSFLKYSLITLLAALFMGVSALVIAHRAFKQANGGFMSFGQGVMISVMMMLIVGVFSGVFNYVHIHYIDPEFVERFRLNMVEFMEKYNMPDEEIEKNTARINEMKVGFVKSVLTGLGNGMGGGVILGLIVSAFTKRNPSEFE